MNASQLKAIYQLAMTWDMGEEAFIREVQNRVLGAQADARPVWQPIDKAPTDNKRLLYLARFDAHGKLQALDFDGSWDYVDEGWEAGETGGYMWCSAGGVEEPTHWAYQDEPLPMDTHPEASAPGLSDDEIKAGAHRLWLLEGQGLSKLEHYEAELRTILTRASAATVAEPSDNWRQYAKDGETAQQCIERHRAEHDALLTLLAKAKSNECPLGCEEGICGYEKNGQASACPKESIRWKRERPAQQQAATVAEPSKGVPLTTAQREAFDRLRNRTMDCPHTYLFNPSYGGMTCKHCGRPRSAIELDEKRLQATQQQAESVSRKFTNAEELIADLKQAEPGADERKSLRDKWKIVDGDCREGANGLITHHVTAFDEGWQARAAQSGQQERGTPEQILVERKLTCEAIEGAIAFGYQNTNPPPSDAHWLAPFWKIGRKQSELEQSGQRAGVADAATRMRAAGLGALLSEVYARAGGFLDDDTRERVQQALTDHERAIAAPTQQQPKRD